MLKISVDYKDLGGDYLDPFLNRRAEQRLVQKLRSMGYNVRHQTANSTAVTTGFHGSLSGRSGVGEVLGES
jgi:hypothetical protein